MKVRAALGLLLGALLVMPATAGAVQRTKESAKPYFDSRAQARDKAARSGGTVAAARPSAATNRARATLRSRLGREAVLSIDPLTGTPRQLLRTDGALSCAARRRPQRHRARLRARQRHGARPRRRRPRRPRAPAHRQGHARHDRRALPPALPGHPRLRQRRARGDRPRRARALRGGLAAPRPRRRLGRSEAQRRAGLRRAAAQRRGGEERARPLGLERRPQGDDVRQRRLRPARAVRRGRRRHARLPRAVPRDLAGDVRGGRRRRQRQGPLPLQPDQERRERRGLSEPPGRERDGDRRPRGLRPAGRLDRARRRLVAPVRRRRRRRRRRPGRGDPAERGDELHLSVHTVPDRRARVPGGRAVRLGPGRAHVLDHEPAPERRPGLLPGVALPRPSREPVHRLRR